jgi:hypothetical protein
LLGAHGDHLGRPPGADEGDGLATGRHGRCQQARGFLLGAVLRPPQDDVDGSPRRPVLLDQHHIVWFNADQAAGGGTRVADRGRGDQKCGLSPVVRSQSAEPPQYGGNLRSEQAAIPVRLVHDDEPQRSQERRPALVVGQHGQVQHVRVGQDVRGVVARPVPLGQGRIAVERRDRPTGWAQLCRRAELVVRQRLGGR